MGQLNAHINYANEKNGVCPVLQAAFSKRSVVSVLRYTFHPPEPMLNGKLIVQEGGIDPFLKLIKEGTIEGQEAKTTISRSPLAHNSCRRLESFWRKSLWLLVYRLLWTHGDRAFITIACWLSLKFFFLQSTIRYRVRVQFTTRVTKLLHTG